MKAIRLMSLCFVLLCISVNDLHADGFDMKSFCIYFAKEAEYIMERRQEGISKKTTKRIVAEIFKENNHNSRGVVKNIIDEAYDIPIQHTRTSKRQYSVLFGVSEYGLCMSTIIKE